MSPEEIEQMLRLCQQIEAEPSPQKLGELVAELNELLEKKKEEPPKKPPTD